MFFLIEVEKERLGFADCLAFNVEKARQDILSMCTLHVRLLNNSAQNIFPCLITATFVINLPVNFLQKLQRFLHLWRRFLRLLIFLQVLLQFFAHLPLLFAHQEPAPCNYPLVLFRPRLLSLHRSLLLNTQYGIEHRSRG